MPVFYTKDESGNTIKTDTDAGRMVVMNESNKQYFPSNMGGTAGWNYAAPVSLSSGGSSRTVSGGAASTGAGAASGAGTGTGMGATSGGFWDQYAGGLPGYVTSQQQRMWEAIQSGDKDLQNRIIADATRVGYDPLGIATQQWIINAAQPNQVPQTQTDPRIDALLAQIQNIYNQPRPTLSWTEALSRAQSQLNPLYDEQLENTLKATDQDMIRRGFFGQAPAAAIRGQRAATVERGKQSAIANLANNLVNQDEASARAAQQDALRQAQLQGSLLLSGIQNAQSQKQNDFSKLAAALALMDQLRTSEAEKTGTYLGQPTLQAQTNALGTYATLSGLYGAPNANTADNAGALSYILNNLDLLYGSK